MYRSRILIYLAVALGALCAAPALASAQGSDCPEGFDCTTVSVPLDRSGAVPGTIDLPVAAQRGDGPLMLALGGGPGQGMVSVAKPIGDLLRSLTGHRIAVVDQRGTGAVAIDCPAMQADGLTDFTPPLPGTVEECGDELGAARAFYSTTDTVEDLEAVRQALGVEEMAVLGISYGTYVAERYARAYPGNVSSIVLDSVVPQEDVDPYFRANMRQTSRILEQLCEPRRSRCAKATKNPVGDLGKLVARTNERPLRGAVKLAGGRVPIQVDGPGLFDLVSGLSSFDQEAFTKLPAAVKRALRGKPKPIVRMYAKYRKQNDSPDPASISWGLHSATVCADVAFPWGSPATDPEVRRALVEADLAAMPAKAFGPYDRATAAGNGVVATCERWPATTVAPPPAPGPLPDVPTLFMAGTWDLSTPIADARREARRSPDPTFLRIPEAGHSAVTDVACAQRGLVKFYEGEPLGKTCKAHRAPRR